MQEFSQLEAIYGRHEAKVIYSGGLGNKLFFSSLDLETCNYLEKVLGYYTEYDTLFGGADERARTVPRPLMSNDEIRMMCDTEGVLISGRQRPIRIKMPYCFEDRRLRGFMAKRPYEIDMNYQNEAVEFLNFN